jgi:hypothetical protein
MLSGKIMHEVDQRLHARQRHRVVDRRAHAADRPMPLQLQQAARLRLLEEVAIQRGVLQRERYIHARAVGLADRAVVKTIAGFYRAI